MDLKIVEINDQKIAELIAQDVVINDIRDAMDLMANADYQEAKRIIIEEKHLPKDFFDLRSGMAGEILQKYAIYRMKLAIIGDFEKFKSKSLKAFIVECNRGDSIFFVPDRKTALRKIS